MTTRRLAAILAADVVGFSYDGADEEGTLRLLKAIQRDLIEPRVREHHGRIVKTTGDGFLVEFGSPLEAVRCAVEVQEALSANGAPGGPEEALRFRMGINLGDIIIEEDGDIYGDGVNVATRWSRSPSQEASVSPARCLTRLKASFRQRSLSQANNTSKTLRDLCGFTRRGARFRATEPKQLLLPARPSLAVLPFTNMSDDPQHEYFADGIVEELISALSRVRSFFVIARNSSFTYKGRAVDVRAVGRELGVRYILEDSVRKSGTRIRLSAQLLDASDGSHLWADRYDGELTDFRSSGPPYRKHRRGYRTEHPIERDRASKAKRPDSLDAYDLVMRALPTVWTNDPDGAVQGLALLEQAIKLDPTYPLALALASWCHAQQVIYLNSRDKASDREKALELANEPLASTVTIHSF